MTSSSRPPRSWFSRRTQNIAKLITHLAEMSARTTALELGYKSLYEYCITGLNLSEGAVPARIHVANVSRRFPQLLAALAWIPTEPFGPNIRVSAVA